MPQTIPDPPKQPCWAHGLLVCTGRHGKLLVGLQLRKPNSFSHSEDRCEGGKWDNVLLCSLSSVTMSRDKSIAPQNSWPLSLLIVCAKYHHLMVHFVFPAMCQDQGQCLWLCWAKASPKISSNLGMWHCPCCRMEEDLSHSGSSNWSYPMALGKIQAISWSAELCYMTPSLIWGTFY